MNNLKKFEKFEAEKLEKSRFHTIKGGHTCGSGSYCGPDGNDTDHSDVF